MKTALKYFFLLLSITPGLNTKAQKKVIPVSLSALTGVVLPAGSKQDKRMLSEGAAKILLEIESKKANTGVKNTEVLYLPSLAASGFNSDSLVNQLSGLGWEIIPIEGDDKYVWLQKNGHYIIAYFSMEKKETQLYFAETATTPVLATSGNNSSGHYSPENNILQKQTYLYVQKGKAAKYTAFYPGASEISHFA